MTRVSTKTYYHIYLRSYVSVNDEEVSDGEKGCERAKLAYNCFIENYEQVCITIYFLIILRHIDNGNRYIESKKKYRNTN